LNEPNRFVNYYNATKGRPPRDTLLRALSNAREPGFAIDLACGDGRDTVELLRCGWQVLAIDSEPEAFARLEAREDLANRENLATLLARMEDTVLPECDLVNCSFALPFCPPERFPIFWQRVINSIREGGRFAGQLFGPRDDWARGGGMTIVTRPALDALFAAFEFEHLEEEETEGTGPAGAKHWHIFHVVAKKLAEPEFDDAD
jgi:SAM-dependent methyltransferase